MNQIQALKDIHNKNILPIVIPGFQNINNKEKRNAEILKIFKPKLKEERIIHYKQKYFLLMTLKNLGFKKLKKLIK